MKKQKAYTSIDADTSRQVIFDANTVFVRDNFVKIDEETYELDETVYSMGEYVSLLQTTIKELEEKNNKVNSSQDDMIFEQSYEIALLKLNSANAV